MKMSNKLPGLAWWAVSGAKPISLPSQGSPTSWSILTLASSVWREFYAYQTNQMPLYLCAQKMGSILSLRVTHPPTNCATG